MKQLLLISLIFWSLSGIAQEETNKWQAHLSIGQYPASLAVPRFNPIHPGIGAGVLYQWNKNQKHQLTQSAELNYFYHRYVQHGIQLYTESAYRIKFDNGLIISPFAFGGGYVLSLPDLRSFERDSNGDYILISEVRNNWMVSVGASMGYETNLNLLERPLTFFLDYRVQIQGIFIQTTSPVLAYAPIRIGFSLPLSKP